MLEPMRLSNADRSAPADADRSAPVAPRDVVTIDVMGRRHRGTVRALGASHVLVDVETEGGPVLALVCRDAIINIIGRTS